jgi:hypothetical protein
LTTIGRAAPKFLEALQRDTGAGIELPAAISANSLRQFIQSCEHGPWNPTRESIFDLFVLAHHYECSELRRQLSRHVKENLIAFQVSELLSRISCGLPTTDLETVIKNRLIEFSADDLARLPINILVRIFRFPPVSQPEQFNQTFNLALELCQIVGSSASVLFQSVHFTRLSEAQLHSLDDLPGFIRSFLDHSCLDSFIEQLRQLTERNGGIVHETQQLKSAVDQLRVAMTDLERGKADESAVGALREDITDLRSSIVPRSAYDAANEKLTALTADLQSIRDSLSSCSNCRFVTD